MNATAHHTIDNSDGPDRPGSLVPITIPFGRHTVTVPGQGTCCPHLVVIPVIDGDLYRGFTVAHRPTGRYLGMPARPLTADQATEIADQLAGLDWTSPERDFYDTDDQPHRAAWRAALDTVPQLDQGEPPLLVTCRGCTTDIGPDDRTCWACGTDQADPR